MNLLFIYRCFYLGTDICVCECEIVGEAVETVCCCDKKLLVRKYLIKMKKKVYTKHPEAGLMKKIW